MPITAIVVTFNEERRLRACLRSISFCGELIVCDLGSADKSVRIAEEFGATILHRKRVPIVEMLWSELSGLANFPWTLRLDPDEEFPDGLIDPLRSITSDPGDIGCVRLPLQHYFLEKPLSVSIWGGTQYIRKLFRADRVEFTGLVHQGMAIPEIETKTLSEYAAFPIKHYWVDSLGQMFEKHRRYLGKEGEARYARGDRFSYRDMVLDCLRSARANLLSTRGLFGGWRGIFLAGFHMWYVAGCHLSLQRHERSISPRAAGPQGR